MGSVSSVSAFRLSDRFKQYSMQLESKLLLASSGMDRVLCLWDLQERKCLGKCVLEASGTTLDFDRTGKYILVGLKHGGIAMYHIRYQSTNSATSHATKRPSSSNNRNRSHPSSTNSVIIKSAELTQVLFRKDSKEEIGDVKFSPDNNLIAVGSHDNLIYVYRVALSVFFI